MKLERVTQNKIKITLTGDEMQMWHLDIEKISSNAPEAKEFFLNIIEKAEKELNFDVKDSQLLVEAVMKSEVSVIHISKIFPDSEEYNKILNGKLKKIEVRVRHKAPSQSKNTVFKFKKIDDTADACRLIQANFEGYSSFYKMDSAFYLVMENYNCTDQQTLCTLSEFGVQIENFNVTVGKLNEYGQLIIKDKAIETLSTI